MVGSIESNVAIKKKYATPGKYSEQHLVDCGTPSDYMFGCNGGATAWAFDWIGRNGLAANKDYAYTAQHGACKTKVAKTFYLTSQAWTWVFASPLGMRSKLLSGPISVCVDAYPWFSYSKGIFGGCPASTTDFNHAVVLVGIDSNGNYKMRNSWVLIGESLVISELEQVETVGLPHMPPSSLSSNDDPFILLFCLIFL